jgi:chemosensory pili system protein ChpE
MTFALLVSALSLGLVFSATPGAVNAESLRRGMARGFRPALLVQLGSLMGDMVWAAVALTGTAFLVQNRTVALSLGIVGACFLLRQAFTAYREAFRQRGQASSALLGRGDFVTGSFYSLTNPFAVAFWLGLGAGVAATAHASILATIGFFAGFFCGAVIWCVTFAALVSVGRRWANRPMMRALDALAGTALSYFGIRLLWRILGALRVLRIARALIG